MLSACHALGVRDIVVGTNLGRRSRRALEHAAQLAQTFEATLHLVAAYTPATTVPGAPELVVAPATSEAVESTEADLEALAADLRLRGLDVRTYVHAGNVADGLCKVAAKVGADVIVVGNRRMKGPGRLFGSVANSVAHRAPCSVYIVDTEHKG